MSKGIYVDASGFGDAFEGILDDFMDQCTLDAKKAVQKGGNACKKQLQATTDPRMTGEYAAGWRMRTDNDRFGGYYVRVYNASKPSLTHLLEFGHEKFIHGRDTGERVPAHPHIEPAYETGAETILKELGR
jgi:hypothetical protein